ncbi:MAG: thioredoxin domain-containing protein, partial [Phormidesmis sp.]
AERWLAQHDLIQEFHQSGSEKSENEKPAEYKLAEGFNPGTTRHVGGYALRKLYHESDRPILVKYASPTCGPCHTLKPILSKVVDEFEGRIYYVEIDITEDSDVAESAGITGTPTVQLFNNKALVGEIKGMKQKSQYRQMIEKSFAELATV